MIKSREPLRTFRRSISRLFANSVTDTIHQRILGVQCGNKFDFSSNLLHPNSGHTLAYYASSHFEKADYTFAGMGEFNLDLIALQHSDNYSISSIKKNTHDVIVYPERIWLKDINIQQIDDIIQLSLQPSATKRDFEKLLQKFNGYNDNENNDNKNKNNSGLIEELENVTILINSDDKSVDKAKEIHNLVYSAASSLSLPIEVYMSSSPTTGLKSSSIMVLSPSTASTAYYEITDHLMSSKDALKLLERFL